MKRAVFLDRDGTLIEDKDYLHRPEEVVIFPGAGEALKRLQDAGFLLVIVIQMLTVAVSLTLAIFFSRNSLNFLPARDYRYFVGAVRTLYERKH